MKMRGSSFFVSLMLASVTTFGVFSQEKQEKRVLTLEQQVKINAHIEQLVKGGVPYEAAERRALAVFESWNRVSTRSRLATPPIESIWINRDPDNLINPHPVYNNATAEYLVKNVLLSDPAAQSNIINVSFQGNNTDPYRSLAYFENGAGLGIEKGLILGTGNVLYAEGHNSNSSEPNLNNVTPANPFAPFAPPHGISGDPHLEPLEPSGFPVNDVVILEFDFRPYTDKVTFDFIFASEEFPEYSNTSYNDIFGFFVWDVNDPSDYKNIALFPNGDPVTIGNSNWGNTGDNSSTGLSAPVAGAVNPQWHRPNYTNSDIMEYDGHTVVLQAVADNLDTEKTYHLKLAIANVSDNAYGSAVFLSNLDLGSAGIDFTSPYLSGHRANSSFHGVSADYSSISGGVKEYVEGLIGSDPNFSSETLEKYKGFLYSDCKYTIDEDQLTFEGPSGNVILDICGDDKFKEYIQIDSMFIGGEKVEYCYEGGTGREKSILDYTWGKDSINRGEDAVDGAIYFYMKQLPDELNGKPFGLSNFLYNSSGMRGLGDTIVFVGFGGIRTDIKYSPVMGNINAGSLTLGLEGGSKYIRWANVDGLDCDAEYSQRCRWRYLRDTITGKELPFSNWELLSLYNGDERVSIIIQEPGSCNVDTVWIGGGSFADIQRYISIPYIPGVAMSVEEGKHYVSGHKDFSFTAKFTGEPMNALATGYYSNTVLNLDETAEELADGSYKYTIRRVVEPWTVTFVPRLNSGDVSNKVFDRQSVWSSGNTLYIKTEKPCTATIYTITGLLYKQVKVGNDTAINLPKGFYVVSVNGIQYKVVIK